MIYQTSNNSSKQTLQRLIRTYIFICILYLKRERKADHRITMSQGQNREIQTAPATEEQKDNQQGVQGNCISVQSPEPQNEDKREKEAFEIEPETHQLEIESSPPLPIDVPQPMEVEVTEQAAAESIRIKQSPKTSAPIEIIDIEEEGELKEVQPKEIEGPAPEKTTIELLQQVLESYVHEEAVEKLKAYFPDKTDSIAEMNQDQIRDFVVTLIKTYNQKLLPQAGDEVEYDYPPKNDMIALAVDILPEMKSDIQAMNDEELKNIFKQIMQELKKINVEDRPKLAYFQLHPFEIKLNARKDLGLIPSFPQLLNFLQEKDPNTYSKFIKNSKSGLEAKYLDLVSKAREIEKTLIQGEGMMRNEGNQTNTISVEEPAVPPHNQSMNIESVGIEREEVKSAPVAIELPKEQSNPQENVFEIQQNKPSETEVVQVEEKKPNNEETVEQNASEKQQIECPNIQVEEGDKKIQSDLKTTQKGQENTEQESKPILHKPVIEINEEAEKKQEAKSVQINQPETQAMQAEEPLVSQVQPQDDVPQRRTFQEMNSTSIPPTKKTKFNIAELRVKLVQKLPQLKDSIMQLNDEEIEKIFLQSLKTSEKQQSKPAEQIKPPSPRQNNRVVTRSFDQEKINGKQESHEEISHKELYKSKNKNESTEVLEFDCNSEGKKKKSKTIVLIHSENLQEDEISKMRRLEEQQPKKCDCACCRDLRAGVPEPLRTILRILTQK